MLVIDDKDLSNAKSRLRSAGFEDWTRPYSSLDLSFCKEMQLTDAVDCREFTNLDYISSCFTFPKQIPVKLIVVLVPSSYAHVTVTPAPELVALRQDGLIWPNSSTLLQSFVGTLMRETEVDMWTAMLGLWALFVYGKSEQHDHVLSGWDDATASEWFKDVLRLMEGYQSV